MITLGSNAAYVWVTDNIHVMFVVRMIGIVAEIDDGDINWRICKKTSTVLEKGI